MIGQFGRKRYQKKCKDLSQNLLWGFSQKYLVVHVLQAVKNSLIHRMVYFERYCTSEKTPENFLQPMKCDFTRKRKIMKKAVLVKKKTKKRSIPVKTGQNRPKLHSPWNTVPREALKYRKKCPVLGPFFIRHAPGITKIPK